MKAIEIKNPAQAEKDKACVKAMCGKNKAKAQLAFNEIYARYKSAVMYKVAMRFVKNNKEKAEDLTQEIFEKVYVKIKTYDFSTCFSTWLYTVALNHCRDYKRTERYEILSVETLKAEFNGDEDASEVAFQIEDKSEDVFKTIVKMENSELINRAIGRGIMSSKGRRVIRLIFLKELTYEEVSDRMNLPLGTVKAFMFRAKQDLKDYLSKKTRDFQYIN
jgi:RNA polymerase sigma-70 factor (ECF subfamily)